MKIAFAPNGKRIVGTLETLQGVASIYGVTEKPDGTLVVDYAGDTKVDWDSQIPVLNNRKKRIFVDEAGGTWSEVKLVLKEDDTQLAS